MVQKWSNLEPHSGVYKIERFIGMMGILIVAFETKESFKSIFRAVKYSFGKITYIIGVSIKSRRGAISMH